VQVVVFLISMLPMLLGFHLLRRLSHLASAGWGRDADGETQDRECHQMKTTCSVAGHGQWAPIPRDSYHSIPYGWKLGQNFPRARLYPGHTFSLLIEAKGYLLVTKAKLLRHNGYEVISVVGNEAAKIVPNSPRHCDLFIVGHAAPGQTRKEMVDWLKAKSPL
jgi:hypothetical protein